MKRMLWSALIALVLGAGVGLGYAWVIAPHPNTDAQPSALRGDFKDQYRSVIAAAFAATRNLPRAEARLSTLQDASPIDELNAQAQRMLASAQSFERADQVAALAFALEAEANGSPLFTPTMEVLINAGNTFTPTSSAEPVEASDDPTLESGMPEAIETQSLVTEVLPTAAVSEATPHPTQTATPAPGKPFTLTGQETTCDSNVPEGLLQVIVLNRSRRQIPGVEIVITWDGGKEQFFTGLKPELGNGYADYVMTPDTTYTVQLARGSDVALGITATTCQTPDGVTFLGGIKLTFQQP